MRQDNQAVTLRIGATLEQFLTIISWTGLESVSGHDHGLPIALSRQIIFGLTARTVVVFSFAAILAMGATIMTGRVFDRLRASQERLTKVEVEELMTSVRLIQQTETLIGLGLMLAHADNHNERRRAMMELNDRQAWIAELTSELTSAGQDQRLIEQAADAQRHLSENIQTLNVVVRYRIDARHSEKGPVSPDLEEQARRIRQLSMDNRELAGQLSVLMSYFSASKRRQLQNQSEQFINDIQHHNRNLFILTILLLLSTLGAGLYFKYGVVDRVVKLQRAVDQDEVDPTDLTLSGNDEVAQLAYTVKRYVRRIQLQEARMKQINADLAFLAEHDPLTQLANRRHFDVAARQLLQHSRAPLCIAIIDIDHFKRVNDRYGHAVGDLALQHVVRWIQAGLRESDVLARLGGEEFCVAAPMQSIMIACDVFDRIRQRIANEPMPLDHGGSLRLTLSSGLTLIEGLPLPQDADPEQMQHLLNAALRAADEALYTAKHGGRNQVRASSILFNAMKYLSDAPEVMS